MANSESSKTRVLAIYHMLSSGQKLTASQILTTLDLRYGITADRKTIYSDSRAVDRIMPIEISAGQRGGYQKLDVLGRCEDGKL